MLRPQTMVAKDSDRTVYITKVEMRDKIIMLSLAQKIV